MNLEIIFAPRAKETLISTVTFIKAKWGNSAAERFKKRVYKLLSVISKQPYLYKASEFDVEVRQGFITKQCSVFYQIHRECIEILFFWDNRQEPIFTMNL